MDAMLWPDLSHYRCAVWESSDGRAVLRPIFPSRAMSDALSRALDQLTHVPHSIVLGDDYTVTLDARATDIDWVAAFELASLREKNSLRQPPLLALRRDGPFACAQWYWVCDTLDNGIAFDLDGAPPPLPLVAMTVTEESAAHLSSRYRPVSVSDAYNFVSVGDDGVFIAVDRSVVKHLSAEDLRRARPARIAYPELPAPDALSMDLTHNDVPSNDDANPSAITDPAPADVSPTPDVASSATGKRQDFGEKIGGARKDAYERSDALQLTSGLIDSLVASMKQDGSPGRMVIDHEKARRLEQALRAIKRDSVFPKQTKKQIKERLASGHHPAAILLYDSIRTRIQPNAYPLYDRDQRRGKYYVYMPDNLDSARLAALDYEMVCTELARRLASVATVNDAVALLMPALDADRPDRFNRRADAVRATLGTGPRLDGIPDDLSAQSDAFLHELQSLDTIALLARVRNMDKLPARREFCYSRVTSDPDYSFQLASEIAQIAIKDALSSIKVCPPILTEIANFANSYSNGKQNYIPTTDDIPTREFMTQLANAYRNGEYPVNDALQSHLASLLTQQESALLSVVQAQAGLPVTSTLDDAEDVSASAADDTPDVRNPILDGLGDLDAGRIPSPRFEHLSRTGLACRDGDIQEADLCTRFGLRGIEYGNWVSQNERQDMLNMAYDSMHDLSQAMGVPESFIGFHGKLALALGARGRGGNTAAHYEPARQVVNMTKTAGAGAFAHEWAHALDHHLGGSCLLSSLPASVIEERLPEMASFAQAITKPDSAAPRPCAPAAKTHRRVRALLHTELRKRAGDIAFRYEMAAQARLPSGFAAEPLPAEFLTRVTPWLDHLEDGIGKEIARTPGYGTFFLDTIFPKEPGVARRTFRSAALIARIDDFLGIDKEEQPREHQMVAALVNGIAFSGFNRLHKQITDLGKDIANTQKTQFLKDASLLGGKSASYWTSAHELFARAFSAVIHDRLATQGIKNDYLSLYSAPDIFNTDGYRASSNPEGHERIAFALAAEPLIAHVQSIADPTHEADPVLRAAAG